MRWPISSSPLRRTLPESCREPRCSSAHVGAGSRRGNGEDAAGCIPPAPPLRSVVGHKQNNCFLLKPEDIFWFSIVDGIVRARTLTDSYWLNHAIGYLEESLVESPMGRGFFRAQHN